MNPVSINLIIFSSHRAASCKLRILALCFLATTFLGVVPPSCLAHDVVEFLTGAKVTGELKDIRKDEKEFDFEAHIGKQVFDRTYKFSKIHAVTMNGKRHVITPRPGVPSNSTEPGDGIKPIERIERTPKEVMALIDEVGRTAPDWFHSTSLNYPRSLDLSWPDVPKPENENWDHGKYIGQFVWDVINPNSKKWREGIRFLHHVVAANKDNPEAQVKAMNQLGALYASLMQDWPRAAFWWQKAGHGIGGGMGTGGFRIGYRSGLAKCYWELGNKQMAVEQLNQEPNGSSLHLWAAMGEFDKAIELGEARAKKWPVPYLFLGDICRRAGRYDQAMAYYQKAADAATLKKLGRLQQDASARMIGLAAEKALDLTKIRDGRYTARSLAYTGMLAVAVTVRDHHITSVKITKHTEKQYYSSLTDIPNQIIQKQSIRGIDATSSATVTADAIVAASAKALVKGMQ